MCSSLPFLAVVLHFSLPAYPALPSPLCLAVRLDLRRLKHALLKHALLTYAPLKHALLKYAVLCLCLPPPTPPYPICLPCQWGQAAENIRRAHSVIRDPEGMARMLLQQAAEEEGEGEQRSVRQARP